MKFIQYEDVERFAQKAEPVLEQGEDVNSLFYGVLQAIRAGKYKDPFMGTVEEDGELLALFQMTPPHALNIILVAENQINEICQEAIRYIVEHSIPVQSIISQKQWAKKFSAEWELRTGQTSVVLMDQGLYRLDTVEEALVHSPGKWRMANQQDSALIEEWYTAFETDTHLPATDLYLVKEKVATFIGDREIFVWEHDGEVVSMMKKSRPTKNSITVTLVFTPTDQRRKGYARTLVAHVSKELLREYSFCVLYTDMLNPTSNKIYKEIGYKHIADSVHIGFM
ncbi:GNAT family N-acetyltransferase [Sporosarcina sp. Te-1]|uniref:GNAT family N-acetyltransferase n=1 Tax=Sporosarcina sp. Te-1 TaxID=2818390 RepID=UPI001A9EF784|nr:GNAT family N-acetyltransferase [Sporosarcina sp. Te-1]QTD41323.1 GNAT family N-acetyltransferase [Sporosarcina sp. Te-1]